MNVLFSIIYLIMIFILTILAYKYFGKFGLYIWIIINLIVSNIQSVKIVDIFQQTVSLGNISYAAVFLATDILNEKYGIKAANKSVYIGFVSIILFTLMMLFTLIFEPSVSDISQDSLVSIFSVLPRISISSLVAYFISQRIDTHIYNELKKKNCKLWIKNNVSTIVSQLIDSILFVSIAFTGVYETKELISLILTMCGFKILLALIDTPFMYLANSIKNKHELD